MHLSHRIAGSFVLFIVFAVSAMADTLTMDDGSVLKGEIIRQEKNTLQFKTTYAGTIKIKWDQVKKLQSEKPVTIMLVTDELISTQHVSNIANGVSQIKKEGEDWQTSFKTHNVAFINPDPWRLNQGYKITARANISLKSQHGNTIKDEFELDGRLQFRSLRARYIFTGELENDNARGEKTADNWLFSGKYDYFFSKQRYFGVELSFERDKFTDLNLRTVLGPHVGRQYYESKAINLKAESGIVKVYEDNIANDDQDYLALNWHVNYDQYFFNEFTQFYHRHTGLWDWEKSDKVTIKSWTGFRFPLRAGVVASTEVEFDYDSQPEVSVGKTDTTYRVKLGYEW